MWRTPVLGVAILAAAPSVYAAARGNHDLSFAVTLAAIAGAASLGFAVDDPAEATLTPCPIPRAARRLVRAGLIAITVAASWAVVAVSSHAAGYPLGPLRSRLAETAAAAAISVAFAARAARSGSDSAGLAAVTGTLLVLGTCSGLSLYLTWLPQLGHSLHTARWWVIAAIAALAAIWWSRDPSARTPILDTNVRRERHP
ncbi:MAG: hypothetical protein WBM50_11920 [Acidimicrobiales bacterium]